MNEKPAFWAILPATVRYDENLSSTAKLLYAEISALQEAKGYCFAKNEYFSHVFGVNKRTVQRLIRELETRGHILVQFAAEAGGDLVRKICTVTRTETATADTPEDTVAKFTGGDKNVTPRQECHEGDDKNVVEGAAKMSPINNTSINNTSITPQSPPTGGRRPKSQPEHKPERFERFWAYYRSHARGENRQGAIRAWDRLKPTDVLIDIMAAALARQVKCEDWKKGVGIPYASTWLNNARWEDAVGLSSADGPSSTADARGGLEAW